jgi:hypothetical protein
VTSGSCHFVESRPDSATQRVSFANRNVSRDTPACVRSGGYATHRAYGRQRAPSVLQSIGAQWMHHIDQKSNEQMTHWSASTTYSFSTCVDLPVVMSWMHLWGTMHSEGSCPFVKTTRSATAAAAAVAHAPNKKPLVQCGNWPGTLSCSSEGMTSTRRPLGTANKTFLIARYCNALYRYR